MHGVSTSESYRRAVDPSPFKDLIGEPLSVVGFAAEGVHLWFGGPEGPRLSGRHAPEVERQGVRHAPGDDGYGDALRQTAGASLLQGYATATNIALRLSDATTLTMHGDDDHRQTDEDGDQREAEDPPGFAIRSVLILDHREGLADVEVVGGDRGEEVDQSQAGCLAV
jgi:hypothetical protein